MEQIIFICTGNTCRSPMAEGLFRAHNGEEKTGLTAASAGLYTENGLPRTRLPQPENAARIFRRTARAS